MLRFKTLAEEKPKTGVDLLIRYKPDYEFSDCESGYYIVRYYIVGAEEYFEEAGGEQYITWKPHEILGWMYASELDSL